MMASQHNAVERKLVWTGRPSVSVYYSIYGAISAIIVTNLVIAEILVRELL